MAASLQRVFYDHPDSVFIGLFTILAIFSMNPTPGMVPMIATLSLLLVYSRMIFPSFARDKLKRVTMLCAALTVGGVVPRFTASLDALSQRYTSILSLILLSLFTSAFCIVALYSETWLTSRFSSDTNRLLLFPTIWVALWAFIATVSPLGTLSTWSPVEGTGAYDWLVPWLSGPYALNWVVAAWATVLSQAIMSLYMGSGDPGDAHATNVRSSFLTANNKTALFAVALTILAIPSYIENSLPLPLGDVSKSTLIVVGCALPTFDEYKVPEFKFKHFLDESKRLDNTANFILWPEGAVHFGSEEEKNNSLAEVQKSILHAFVGVSFEETIVNTENPNNRHGAKRTGIAIVSNRSTIPHLVYYKQHLVPIAESFSLIHSLESPTTFSAEITYPKRIPVHGHKREISVTASICLDFSAPSQFTDLEVRPGLILAPARTWDVTVGYTMWKQASQRAHEMRSTVLWCDGGDGGVSGVAGHGYNEVVEVGSGSWTRTIALEFPFNEDSRTLYARYGNAVLLVFFALLSGVPIGRAGSMVGSNMKQHGGNLAHYVIGRLRRRRASPVENLIDV